MTPGRVVLLTGVLFMIIAAVIAAVTGPGWLVAVVLAGALAALGGLLASRSQDR